MLRFTNIVFLILLSLICQSNLDAQTCPPGETCGGDISYVISYDSTDDSGFRSTQYDEYYKGVPVMGGWVIYTVDVVGGAGITEIIENRKFGMNLSVVPSVTAPQALSISSSSLSFQGGAFISDPQAKLVVFPKITGDFVLAYYVYPLAGLKFADSGATRNIIDANTGSIIAEEIDLIFTPSSYPGSGTVTAGSDILVGGTKLSRLGKRLRYEGVNARLMGYSDYLAPTKIGFNRENYLKNAKGKIPPPSTDKRYVNLQRYFAFGYSNLYPQCPSGDCFCAGTEKMPIKFSGGEYKVSPVQFDTTFFQAGQYLDKTLSKARDHGQVVELSLFDGWSLQSHWKCELGADQLSPWHPDRSNMPACPHNCGMPGEPQCPNPCLPRNKASGCRRDPFPEFYQIFSNGNQDPYQLNALGEIQKAYVFKVMDTVKNYDNVFVEIMNEARWDPKDTPNVDVNLFKNWHKAVATWVKDRATGFLVSASVQGSLPNEAVNAYEAAVYGLSQVDIISLHFKEWENSGGSNPCPGNPPPAQDPVQGINKFIGFNRPIIIDDDGGSDSKRSAANVECWATQVEGYTTIGAAHFNHLDSAFVIDPPGTPSTCIDCNTMRKLRDRLQTLVDFTSTADGPWCDTH